MGTNGQIAGALCLLPLSVIQNQVLYAVPSLNPEAAETLWGPWKTDIKEMVIQSAEESTFFIFLLVLLGFELRASCF
jgi:hypothetical protein